MKLSGASIAGHDDRDPFDACAMAAPGALSGTTEQPMGRTRRTNNLTRDINRYRASQREAGDGLFWVLSTDGRSMGDGIGRAVAGGRFGPGVVSPGMGASPPECSRDRAAGLSRTGRAPGVLFRVLFSFAGGIRLPRPGRQCALSWLLQRLPAPAPADEAPRRRRPGLHCDPPGPPAPLRVRGGALRQGCSWPSSRSLPCPPFRPRRKPPQRSSQIPARQPLPMSLCGQTRWPRDS